MRWTTNSIQQYNEIPSLFLGYFATTKCPRREKGSRHSSWFTYSSNKDHRSIKSCVCEWCQKLLRFFGFAFLILSDVLHGKISGKETFSLWSRFSFDAIASQQQNQRRRDFHVIQTSYWFRTSYTFMQQKFRYWIDVGEAITMALAPWSWSDMWSR